MSVCLRLIVLLRCISHIIKKKFAYLKDADLGALLVVQWLRRCLCCGRRRFDPWSGNFRSQCGQKKNDKEYSLVFLVYLQNCTPSLPSNFRTFSISTHINTQPSSQHPPPQKKRHPYPPAVPFPSRRPSHCNHWPIFCLYDLPTVYMAFCVWLISYSTMVSRFVHNAACVSMASFFMSET